MTQGEIEQLTVKTENIFSELEVRIMSDIVRRIKENGVSTASADWQISRLQQLGMSEKQIRTWIQKALEASDKEMNRIFSDEAYREYYGHARAYKLAELQQIPFEQNTFLQQLLEVTKQRLESEYRNIAGSMGFAIRDPATGKIRSAPLMEYYRSTLDNAVMDIHSGAFDYNTVLRRTINQMTASGIRYIEYDSGHRDRVNVAVRRAVLTGFRQVQGKINEQVAADLNTDQYEVSYHVGARPTHEVIALRGHTIELGCTLMEFSNGETGMGSSSNGWVNYAFGIGVNTDNPNTVRLYANTQDKSEVWDGEKICCLKYTIPNDATSLVIGFQSYGFATTVTVSLKDVYMYDLGEEVSIRGKDSTNASLRLCRINEEQEELTPSKMRNALYITEKGGMYCYDLKGVKVDIAGSIYIGAAKAGYTGSPEEFGNALYQLIQKIDL